MRLSDFKVLSFDCYGTLIDWERGILEALAPLRAMVDVTVSDDVALAAFAALETAQEAGAQDMLYPEVLARVHASLATRWGAGVTDEMHKAFGESVGRWPPFPDSAGALTYLGRHYKLVVLSNVDNSSFGATRARLGTEFDAVYTAEGIGAYKPSLVNFDYLIEGVERHLGCTQDQVLHTAQSLFHDLEPAKTLGLATAWIDRRQARPGRGATPQPTGDVSPDFTFPSLADLVGAHQRELES